MIDYRAPESIENYPYDTRYDALSLSEIEREQSRMTGPERLRAVKDRTLAQWLLDILPSPEQDRRTRHSHDRDAVIKAEHDREFDVSMADKARSGTYGRRARELYSHMFSDAPGERLQARDMAELKLALQKMEGRDSG